MKKLYLLLLLIFVGVNISDASNIKGTVKNTRKIPLEFVNIHIVGTTYKTQTDSAGIYILENIPRGSYELQVSSGLYKAQTLPITVSDEPITIIAPIMLEGLSHELGEVVISSTRHNYTNNKPSGSIRLSESLLEVPQNIQVVNSEVMKELQITSMSDGLTGTVSGLMRLEHWGDSYTRINTRGARMSGFREGMNITTSWGPLTEDMSFVEAVEFVKGPAGFLMSNGEASGIYNVVLKKPTGQKRGQVGFTYGSDDMYRATFDSDGKLDKNGKLLYRLNLMGQSKNSFRQYEFNKRYSIAPVISYQIDDKTKLTAEYVFQYMKSSNTGSFYNFSANGYAELPHNFSLLEPGLADTRVDDHSLILNLQHEISSNWKLTAQGAYFNYNKEGESMWYSSVAKNGDMVRTVSIGDALIEMKFGQLYLNGDVKTGAVNHRILTGLDMGDKHSWHDWSQTHALDTIGSFNIYNSSYRPGNPYYGYPHFDRSRSLKERANTTQITQSYTGLYLQDELGFVDNKLRLTLAGRYTYVKDSSYGTTKTEDKHFSPRVGLSYSIEATSSVYALYDQTFNPKMGQLRSGDKAKPITGNNWELGFKKAWFDRRWNTSISVYQILKNNETTADPDNTSAESYVIQVGQSKAKGIEIDLLGEITRGLSIIGNYAYTSYKVSKSIDPSRPVGLRLPGYATHMFNIFVKYRFQEGLLEGFNLSVGESSQLDRSSWGAIKEDGKSSLPNYIRCDAGAGWQKGNLSIMLNVYNVLNRYLYSGSVSRGVFYWQSEPKRNFKLGVTYSF